MHIFIYKELHIHNPGIYIFMLIGFKLAFIFLDLLNKIILKCLVIKELFLLLFKYAHNNN